MSPVKSSQSRILEIIPTPFEWIDIPEGKVTLVNTWHDDANVYLKQNVPQTFDVPAFKIAKYPVTNAQFAEFIKAGGYTMQKWWTPHGWQTRDSEQWTAPHYWANAEFNSATQPVVGISWYESIAFCRWLSETAGENISLPTEQQWQRSAQGDDNRIYPWGNEWDTSKCNSDESSIGKTTPVTQYEGKGDSPFGVVDLAGNVWEWCLTEYYSGNMGINRKNIRVVRGGAWYLNQDRARAVFRDDWYPGNRVKYIGFRVARST